MEKIEIIYFSKACGCSKIEKLIQNVVNTENLDVNIIIKNGADEGAKFGIPELPALLINKKLAFSGYNPSKKELKKYLLKI